MNHRTANLRAMILAAVVALMGALLLGGAAKARGIPIIYCADQDPETARCDGTDREDNINGKQGDDVLSGGGDRTRSQTAWWRTGSLPVATPTCCWATRTTTS